jgi:hypothetical protein
MLPELHNTLRTLLYDYGRIDPADVDIKFSAPKREEIDRLLQPAIFMFLFDLVENLELRRNAAFRVTTENGQATRRPPARRIDLYYLVTAISSEVDDEHRLLWRALSTLMNHPEIPQELLPEAYRDLDYPLAARVAQPNQTLNLLDIWSALNVEPHPAFVYVTTVPLDIDLEIRAPLVLTRSARYYNAREGAQAHFQGLQIGGVVRDAEGRPVEGATVSVVGRAREAQITDQNGQYQLRNLQPGPLEILVVHPDGAEQRARFEIPGENYDIARS